MSREHYYNTLIDALHRRDKRIAELEKLGNEMAIIIADLRAHLKIRGE